MYQSYNRLVEDVISPKLNKQVYESAYHTGDKVFGRKAGMEAIRYRCHVTARIAIHSRAIL